MPGKNLEYWEPKLRRNVERDKANAQALRQLGWDVLEVWECQVRDLEQLEGRLAGFLANGDCSPLAR